MTVNLITFNTITSVMIIIIYTNLKKNHKLNIEFNIEHDNIEHDFRFGFNDLS